MKWGMAGDMTVFGTFHTVINGDLLESGTDANTLTFASSGDPADSATFSDVVLMSSGWTEELD